MLDIDWKTLLFQIINFVVLFLVLSRYLFKPLKAKLSERGRVVAETLQNARDRENEAALLRQQREAQLEEVRLQAEEILQEAQAQADQRSEELLSEARERMEAQTAQMREDMIRQRDELVAGHYDEILDAVIDLSGNVVQSVTTRRTHDDLVTNFLASIYQMPQDEVDEYRRSMTGRMPTAFVVTPVPLSQDQTRTVSDTLSSLIDRRVELQVSIDPSLIAGIQIRLADRLIDNSIRQQMVRIRERVHRDMISRIGEMGRGPKAGSSGSTT